MNDKIKYGRISDEEDGITFVYPNIYDSEADVMKYEGVDKKKVVAIIPAHLVKASTFPIIAL